VLHREQPFIKGNFFTRLSKPSSSHLILIGAFLPLLIFQSCLLVPETRKTINNPAKDLSRIENGIYRGVYAESDDVYEVAVTVNVHRITDVTIKKYPERSHFRRCSLCNAEEMIDEIIENGTLEVDAVAGATRTTQAIFKAMENALTPPVDRSFELQTPAH
jgi:uncharacterized protein with FMN-binding domain